MDIIQITNGNIEEEHICCALSNDKNNKAKADSKKSWMREQFKNGLVFKRLNERGKKFIEYMPVEYAWKPVSGDNLMLINCLWVSGSAKKKGIGTALLDECINESKKMGKYGIAVVTSEKNKAFLTEKKYFLKKGFITVDEAPPYFELMVLQLDEKMQPPRFNEHVRTGSHEYKDGFAFVFSNQCPFTEDYVQLLANKARENGIPAWSEKLENHEEAQKKGSPFGTLGIYYKGAFLTHELMPEKKFSKIVDELL